MPPLARSAFERVHAYIWESAHISTADGHFVPGSCSSGGPAGLHLPGSVLLSAQLPTASPLLTLKVEVLVDVVGVASCYRALVPRGATLPAISMLTEMNAARDRQLLLVSTGLPGSEPPKCRR